jgi:hypothetical protein
VAAAHAVVVDYWAYGDVEVGKVDEDRYMRVDRVVVDVGVRRDGKGLAVKERVAKRQWMVDCIDQIGSG